MSVKTWMKQEVALHRKAGTYFFYGEDASRLEKVTKDFAKALLCKEEEDFFCDDCDSCKRIDNGTYADIHRLDSLLLDDIRAMEGYFYESPYEGEKKIFILPNVQDLRKESANALLKAIEEPGDGNFFLLWGTRKNILSTIRSRATKVFVPRLSYQELGVSRECYEFFQGQEGDIRACLEHNCDWAGVHNYANLKQYIESYLEEGKIEDKIAIYQALRDFLYHKENISPLDKLYVIEELCSMGLDRKIYAWIARYCIVAERHKGSLEKKLELSKMLAFPVNIKLFFINLFFS